MLFPLAAHSMELLDSFPPDTCKPPPSQNSPSPTLKFPLQPHPLSLGELQTINLAGRKEIYRFSAPAAPKTSRKCFDLKHHSWLPIITTYLKVFRFKHNNIGDLFRSFQTINLKQFWLSTVNQNLSADKFYESDIIFAGDKHKTCKLW
jgi:hypothetical protein